MQKQKKKSFLSVKEQTLRCFQFIKEFEDFSLFEADPLYQIYGNKKYLIEMQKVANFEKKAIQIQMEDLDDFFRKEDESEMKIGFRINTARYISIFEEVIADLMPSRNKPLNPEQETEQAYINYLREHRMENIRQKKKEEKAESETLPFRTFQNYDVLIVFGPSSKEKVRKITEITSEMIGSLVMTRAIVVRASEVRPELVVGAYACEVCGYENYQQIFDDSYKPENQCPTPKCKEQKAMGKLTFLHGHSTFRQFQELKIQETPNQLKRGSIPKSIKLELKGSLVNECFPGDLICVQGVVLPKRRGNPDFSGDLLFDSYIRVTKIFKEKKKYMDMEVTEQYKNEVLQVKESMEEDIFFKRLANSIAPQIYGLQFVKKSLLLQMAGGVTTESDNLRIRGEINIALFGDPGIAKSQLLKHISHISPRAVYTTGKGSSGVGLTAAVVTDPTTKELSLEAGALVLADMGVCCIDEFDKMDEYDRTAIHEVMQQQTVSITKAGIITTLNARTAVLAAANPVYGRYNKRETTQKNLNLPAALLSRFDLIFILLDTAESKTDIALAKHIGRVHQNKQNQNYEAFDEKFLKTYLSICKSYEPIIPGELHDEMVKRYIEKRQEQVDASKQGESYTTMRSLLALIRLSQARAKLRLSNEVSLYDVIESLQIIHESQISVGMEVETGKKKTDTMGTIYDLIKSLCGYSNERKVSKEMLQKMALQRGFKNQDIDVTLANYGNLGVLMINNQEQIMMIDAE